MSAEFTVFRSPRYEGDLQALHDYVEQDNPDAALDLILHIDDQVSQLADPNFPRRRGRKVGTLERVAHPNYVVVLRQTDTTVIALAVMHVARQYP
jgi:toxin ParE1/3/4